MSASSDRIAYGRIGRDTATYTAGILINRAASFFMLPIYSRYLSPQDYGVIQLVEMTLDFAAILAGARLVVGLFRYYHSATTEDERRAVTSTSFLLICCAYMSVSLVVTTLAVPLSRLVFHGTGQVALIRIAAAALAAQSLSIVPLAYARARGRSDLFVLANAIQLGLQISLNLFFLVYLRLGPKGAFLSNLTSSLVVGLVLAGTLIRSTGLRFSSAATRRLTRYGLPLVATQIATFFATFGDRYFLNNSADMTTVGLYALAYQFGFMLQMVGSMPVELVWEPIRFSLAERPDHDRVLSRAFVYLNVLLISAALGITLFVGDVLRVMTIPAFYPAARLVPVILVAYVFQSWTGMQDVGIHLRERTEYITAANWVAGLVAMAGYFLLIPSLLGLGAAIATVLAFAVRFFMVQYISRRLLPVRYQWTPVLRLIGLAAVAAAISFAVPSAGILGSLALRGMLFLGYVFAAWNAGVLTGDERAFARRIVSTRLRRGRAEIATAP